MDSGSGVRRRKQPKVEEKEVVETKTVHRSIGWLKAALTSVFLTFIVIPLVLMLLPCPIKPEYIRLPQRPEWTDHLRPNRHLQKANKLFYDEILGPESMVADGDYLYTGTADGKVMEIHRGEMRVLTKLGEEPCGRFEDEPTCGRPLGMRLDKDGYLIIVDAYLGLFKVNVATGDKTLLWPSSAPVNGRLPKFMNDIDIGPDGTYFISDSSTVWDRRNNRYCVLEGDSTGRMFAYYPDTNTTEELVTGIPFANGVTLTTDKTAVLLACTTKAAIYRYHLEGPRKGELDDFNNNLPGLPDNIRRGARGGYWVGLAGVRKPEFSLVDIAAANPWIRGLIAKIFSQEMLMKLLPKYGMIIQLNEHGDIVRSLHDPTGTVVPAVSEVEDTGTVLYLGSYYLPFLSKLYASDILDLA